MSIFDDLLAMSPEDRHKWAKQWLKALEEASEKARGDPVKARKLGEKLAEHNEEFVAAMLIAMVKDEYLEEVMKLREVLFSTLVGQAVRVGMNVLPQVLNKR